jgi:tetratricopeptide (TPR) repeat protein
MSRLERLKEIVAAHPGLLLVDAKRARFAAVVPDLAAIEAVEQGDAARLSEARAFVAQAHRKLGRLGDAHAAVDRALAVERTFLALVTKASIHRVAREADAAIALYAEAAALVPTDTTALMDGARTLGEVERYAESAAWFGRVVARDPEHLDAFLWGEYAGHCADGDEAHIERIRAVVEKHPDAELAKRLVAFLQG